MVDEAERENASGRIYQRMPCEKGSRRIWQRRRPLRERQRKDMLEEETLRMAAEGYNTR